MEVFLVHHVHVQEDGEEDVKFIGVYSTRENAERAKDRAGVLPGFCQVPEGFSVERYLVDEDHWTEGYITVTGEMIREWQAKQESGASGDVLMGLRNQPAP